MEIEYLNTLKQVAWWLGGQGEFDMFKPLNAHFANQIRGVCIDVAYNGMTLDEAIKNNQ